MSLLSKMMGFGRNAHYDRGVRLFDQGRYEEALAELQLAENQGGKRDEVTRRLITFYMGESYTHLGHLAMKHGCWDRAEQCFRNALEIHPQYADLHFHLALALRAQKRLEDALVSLENALQINPRFAKAHFYKGLIGYEQGARDEGLASLYRALELEPGFRTEAFHRAVEYHQNGDFLAALQTFEQVSHTEVDDILFHYRLGDDLLRRGLYDEAIAEYQKALALNPNYADIRNHLGMALSMKGLFTEAVAEFEHALRINPRFVDAMVNLAVTLRDNGRVEEAQNYFQKALELDPYHPVVRSNLGLSEEPEGACDRAA
ncbi:MAG: tetratricopeptide repeat protein [Chloroherpetonaceae bacterium]|nr:tetratricopeptide repeat protein [Chthonomonadaceae bacterium]MDW8207823.1 tetratricopeptide repeat protein [Chloroherpetonaceae bacterium]